MTATKEKSRETELEEALDHYRQQIAELPAAIREEASKHFEADVRYWETIHGRPLVEEKDFQFALVSALMPTVDELCDGGLYTTNEFISNAIQVLALEAHQLKREVKLLIDLLQSVGMQFVVAHDEIQP